MTTVLDFTSSTLLVARLDNPHPFSSVKLIRSCSSIVLRLAGIANKETFALAVCLDESNEDDMIVMEGTQEDLDAVLEKARENAITKLEVRACLL